MQRPIRFRSRPDPNALWDVGPPRPVEPERPPAPPEQPPGYAADVSALGYRLAMQDYEARYVEYSRLYEEWQKYANGPIQVVVASAKEALANDAAALASGKQTRQRFYTYNPGFVP